MSGVYSGHASSMYVCCAMYASASCCYDATGLVAFRSMGWKTWHGMAFGPSLGLGTN